MRTISFNASQGSRGKSPVSAVMGKQGPTVLPASRLNLKAPLKVDPANLGWRYTPKRTSETWRRNLILHLL